MAPSPPRVLVVDDEAGLRDLIVAHLQTRGFAVEGVGDAETALDLVTKSRYDAVVLDNNLPGMMGITALPKIVAKGKCVVVMITGHPSDETKRDALLLGAKALMSKPLDLDALTAKLLESLRR